MKIKTYIFLGLLFAVLLISPTVAAKRTQDEKNSNEVQETSELDDAEEPEQYRSRCSYGCCAWNAYGCRRCCRTEEATEGKYQVAGDSYGGGWGGPGGGGYGGGWGGRGGGGYGGGWGGRGRGGYGGGWGGRGGGYGGGWGGRGGGYGGRCQWGCCGYNRGGGCRCCYNAEEARTYLDNEVRS